MLIDNRLANALGVAGTEAVIDDSELSRQQLVAAGEAMTRQGLAIVLNEAGTKIPFCILTAREAKAANQAAIDAALTAGDPRGATRRHRCGKYHIITDPTDARRILNRISKKRRFNIGVQPRASRVLIVDADTAAEAETFVARCGEATPSLTVRSPGQRDADGAWVHRDGGHFWFEVPEELELPAGEGRYTHPDEKWTAMWGEQQVLVPPSVRDEGAYVLIGSPNPMPTWLLDLITLEASQRTIRRQENAARRANSEPSDIDRWAIDTSWAVLLTAAGWVDTDMTDRCGCGIWTGPGDHASRKSATAHDPGCDDAMYPCDRGHGPIHFWTDHPGEGLEAGIAELGRATLTKIEFYAWTWHDGDIPATCEELGIESLDDGDLFKRHERVNGSAVDFPDRLVKNLEDEDEDEEDADDVKETPEEIAARNLATRVRIQVGKLDVVRLAREQIALRDTPPLEMLSITEMLVRPQPVALVPDMFYRNSLARIFGPPGCGKSFVMLDIALTLAAGRQWHETPLSRSRVVYVAAEGEAVNVSRTLAWFSANHAEARDVEGWFHMIPAAVRLTEEGIAALAVKVAEVEADLVVLDTKNAMMIGDENSASDFGVMRRALDVVRTATACCVVLVDHTGYEGTRARGTSAGTAGMDTEIRVAKDDDACPPVLTAEVTRDKAAEPGTRWAWRLVPEFPAAVLSKTEVPTETPASVARPDWATVDVLVPREIRDYKGTGHAAMEPLAKMMMLNTAVDGADPGRVGVSFFEAYAELKKIRDPGRHNTRRSWSWLLDEGWIEPAGKTTQPTGRHLWRSSFED